MKRATDLLAHAAHRADINANGIDELKAMTYAVNSFTLLHETHLKPSQGWHLLTQYYQARLSQDPGNVRIAVELLIAIARGSEEAQHEKQILANAPTPDAASLDNFWQEDHQRPELIQPLAATLLDVPQPEPVTTPEPEQAAAVEAVSEPDPVQPEDPEEIAPAAPVNPEPELSMDEKFAAYEAERARQEEEAWRNTPQTKTFQGKQYTPQPRWLPDEKLAPGRVKEYRNFDDFKSGWWREGYPYKMVIYPQPGAPKDAPEYFIHCTERPSMEEFQQHAQLYYDHLCYVRVKHTDGEKSNDLTREYTNKDANRTVAKTALQETVDDNWTQDADWRIKYFDLRVNHCCYEYFHHRPGGMLLAKYHRAKHYATVESREEWLRSQIAANSSSSIS